MKLFSTLFLSAVAIGASAAVPMRSEGNVKFVDIPISADGLKKSVKFHLPKNKHANAPAKAEAMSEVIYDAPGEAKLFYRNTEGFDISFDGYPFINSKGGVAQKMKYDGNDIYMLSPMSTFATDTWIKGSLTDEGMVFPLPQTIAYQYFDEYDFSEVYDINLFELFHDEEYGDNYYEADGLENRMLLRTMPDGSYQYDTEFVDLYDAEYDIEYTLPRYIIAVTQNWTEDFYVPEWTFYGDFYNNMKEYTGTAVEMPQGADIQRWVVVSERNGYELDMARSGDDVYFKGLFETVPDLCVKGSVANGKVSIPSGQFTGIDEVNHLFCFFYGGPMTSYFNEEYWCMFFNMDTQPEGILEFDEASNRMTTEQGFVVASSPELITASGYLQKPVIMLQPEDISKVPVNPEILDYVNYGYWGDYAAVEFSTSNLDADGYWIGSDDNFEYRLISDGKPVVMSPGDDYPELTEEMEWVPFNFTDDWSLMNDPYLYGDYRRHIVYYHEESKEYTAIQVRYTDPATGEQYLSTPEVFWGEMSGVSELEAGSQTSEQYFNLQGMAVKGKQSGVMIRRSSDGRYSKVMVR